MRRDAQLGRIAAATTCAPRARWVLNSEYLRAVHEAGAIPRLIPPIDDAGLLLHTLERVQGLVLIGGNDIDPERYGAERRNNTVPMDRAREAIDFRLVSLADQLRLPILGICCGLQLINVHRGGTLLQDIEEDLPGALQHRRSATEGRAIGSVSRRIRSSPALSEHSPPA